MTNADKKLVALITGASAGLGYDYAKLFAREGHDVVLVARREDRLRELARELADAHQVQAHVLACDLAESRAAATIFEFCQGAGLEIEFLVNNAGFGTSGPFAELEIERELAMIAVNITSLVSLTSLFVPQMIARGSGRILNIGSVAGFQPGPYMATYYASKAFVNHFSEALWHELDGTGVTVTVSCPGPTATEFGSVAGNSQSKLFNSVVMTSLEVAQSGYQAMMDGRRMVVHGFRNKMLAQSLRLSPRSTVQRIVARLNR